MKRITAILILIILLLPFIDGLFGISKNFTFKSNEMRALKLKPDADINNLDAFPKAYEAYFNDHFIGRDFFIDRYNKMRVQYFGQSPVPEKAFIGKHNWLYLHSYMHNPRNKKYFTDEQLKQILTELKIRENFLKARNCSLYVYIVPTKIESYPEYGGWMAPYEPKLALQTETYIRKNSDLKVTYLLPALLKEKRSSAPFLFLTTDNHWSDYGAYIGYRKIMSDLKEDFPGLNVLPWRRLQREDVITPGGNISRMMSMENHFREFRHNFRVIDPVAVEDPQKKYKSPQDFEGSYELQFNTKDTLLPRVLFIRDSFGDAMVPYLAESFGHTTIIFDKWKYLRNENIVAAEKPEIVVYMIYEPLLFALLGS